MPSILDKIVAAKRVELADVERQAAEQPRPLSLSGALNGGRHPADCRGQEDIAVIQNLILQLCRRPQQLTDPLDASQAAAGVAGPTQPPRPDRETETRPSPS